MVRGSVCSQNDDSNGGIRSRGNRHSLSIHYMRVLRGSHFLSLRGWKMWELSQLMRQVSIDSQSLILALLGKA